MGLVLIYSLMLDVDKWMFRMWREAVSCVSHSKCVSMVCLLLLIRSDVGITVNYLIQITDSFMFVFYDCSFFLLCGEKRRIVRRWRRTRLESIMVWFMNSTRVAPAHTSVIIIIYSVSFASFEQTLQSEPSPWKMTYSSKNPVFYLEHSQLLSKLSQTQTRSLSVRSYVHRQIDHIHLPFIKRNMARTPSGIQSSSCSESSFKITFKSRCLSSSSPQLSHFLCTLFIWSLSTDLFFDVLCVFSFLHSS